MLEPVNSSIDPSKIRVLVASEDHVGYVEEILDTINRAAKVRGTGIAKRSPEYVRQKMLERKAVIAALRGTLCRLQLYRVLEQQTVCCQLRPHCGRRLPRVRPCHPYQTTNIPPVARDVPTGEDFFPYNRCGRNEDELRTRATAR